jgi:hypothetical protein
MVKAKSSAVCNPNKKSRLHNKFNIKNRNRARIHKSHSIVEFSTIEDSNDHFLKVITTLSNEVGQLAKLEAISKKLPRMIVRNNQLLKITAEGVETVEKLKPENADSFYVKYKPNTLIHVIKK